MVSPIPHAAIIGAGPAGTTAALLLARAGWRVTLIEQHRFPRDKVCGECLSATGIDVLDRLALSILLRQRLQPIIFTRTNLHAPDGATITLPLPRPMWGISRSRFDSFLLDAAKAAGANVLQPARCEGIDEHDTHVLIHIRLLETNTIEALRPDVVLLADGKGALLRARPSPASELGIKSHFDNVDGPRDAIELFGVRGCYGGIAAIEQNRWNAAFSVPQDRLHAQGGNIERLFNEITRENDILRLRLRNARRCTPWLAAPLPRFTATASLSPRVIPLGNAAVAIEPIGGEGMGLAMRSAELAAQELLAAQRDRRAVNTVHLRQLFDQLWRRRRFTCRAAALAISSPRLANTGLRRLPAAGALVLHLLGK